MKKLLLPLFCLLFLHFTANTQTVEFSDDFESGTSQWTLEGAWGLTTAQSNSASNSLTDSPGANYAANQNISATMANGIDLSAALDAELEFAAIYDIEGGNFDYCYVEASSDAGATWVNIATFLGEGNLSPWQTYTYSLGGFAGKNDVRVRFRMSTDGGYEVDGIYIDDVKITSSNTDNAAPLVLHTPPEFYESSPGDVTMIADLVDISGISSAMITYSVNGGTAASAIGTNLSMDTYSFTIPEQTAGSQVDYFLTATDASSNNNSTTTPTHSYIAGQHIFYDNGTVDFVNSFGPSAGSNLTGAAVRFSLFGNDIKYALIRNYTDVNRPNADFMFHIWADNNGLPGADLITPFLVTPEANLVENSPMTRVDLSAYSAELSNISGDVFMGYTVTTTETWLVQTTPGIGGRTYVMNAGGWVQNTGDDYHFRLVTTATVASDDCATATNLNGLLGGGVGNTLSSPLFDNTTATTGADDPTDGFDCFGEPDGGGATPSLENTQWYTFTGDGEVYSILTTDCNGTVTDYIDFGDTQIAIYSGNDCGSLTPVACNEDVAGTDPNGPYPAGLDFQTEVGVTYYMIVDGFAGSDGEYCIEFTQIANITCDDIALGDATPTTIDVCFGTATEFTQDTSTIPLEPLSGFLWGIYNADVSGSTNPFNEPSIVGFFGVSATPYTPAIVNDGTQVAAGTYYFTPIVYGGAVDTAGNNNLAGLSFTDGCLITGQSIEMNLLPQFSPLSATSSSVDEMSPPGNNGEASVSVMGGSGSYTYTWSNGGNTATITGLAADTYTVTISDETGCVADLVVDVVVDVIVGTADLAFAQAIQLYPNPAQHQTAVYYNFDTPVDLSIVLTNNIGQEVLTRKVDAALEGVAEVDLSALSDGVYFIKLSDGERQSTQRLVVQR